MKRRKGSIDGGIFIYYEELLMITQGSHYSSKGTKLVKTFRKNIKLGSLHKFFFSL